MFCKIDFSDGLAIYEQVVRQIKFAVAGGVIKPAEMVPSVRELARELTQYCSARKMLCGAELRG